MTEVPEDKGAFKTPTLREIARTAPYMHDGSVATPVDPSFRPAPVDQLVCHTVLVDARQDDSHHKS